MKKICIGAPVFNEEAGITDFLARVDAAAAAILSRWPAIFRIELLIVDDGSSDATLAKIRAHVFRAVETLRIVRLSRNFGHVPAVAALYELADSDALIVMDADLQDQPELLPTLVSGWCDGYESVRVVRGRRGEGTLFSLASKAFYGAFAKISGLPSGMGVFGLFDRKVLDALKCFKERVRYNPGLVTLAGFKTLYITADRSPRARGESRVGFWKLFKLSVQASISFSAAPIHLITAIGVLGSIFSALAGLTVVGIKLFTSLAIPGWASFLTVQFFFGGIMLLSLGVIGQYVAIIFEEVKARPQYIVTDQTELRARSGEDSNIRKIA